ncbi:MAG TPA: hypothetical protein VJG83_00705 [archaeon]|nr:hypothetical protein [archaeon]
MRANLIRLNSKGQGFDVFKLLIAAVVAGAILLILLQTLQILPNIGSQNPNNAASNAVKSKINEPGLPQILDNITFSNGDSLNAKTIAQQSRALAPEQVCVMLSESAPNKINFDDKEQNGEVVEYKGSFSQTTRLLVMCDRASELQGSLSSYGYDDSPYNIDPTDSCNGSSNNASAGNDGFDDESSSRYCLVAIISDQ